MGFEEIMSLIRRNIMEREHYSPYCGNNKCALHWPRTSFNGSQFECKCGWKSAFDEKFINDYKKKWGLK